MIDRLVMKKKTHKEQHMNHNAHVTINISCRNRSSYMVWSQKIDHKSYGSPATINIKIKEQC